MVVDRYHDTPGESGLSPYRIVFGRERFVGNLPYGQQDANEDAKAFFDHMREIDQKVAGLLNEKHERRARAINADRPRFPTYKVGDSVWYRRPENSGTKLDSRWLGPCKVTKRVGEHTYEIQVSERRRMQAHATFLKPHVEDSAWGEPMARYFHQRTRVEGKWVPRPE